MSADDRRKAFIADIVEVCRKHRVMLMPDCEESFDFDDDGERKYEFVEYPSRDVRREDGFSFCVGFWDVEEAVRMACWNMIHGLDDVE